MSMRNRFIACIKQRRVLVTVFLLLWLVDWMLIGALIGRRIN